VAIHCSNTYLGVVFTSKGRRNEEIDTRIGKANAVLRWRGKIHFEGGTIFVFIKFLKKFFWEQENLGGTKEIWGGTAPACPPPWLRACREPPPEENRM